MGRFVVEKWFAFAASDWGLGRPWALLRYACVLGIALCLIFAAVGLAGGAVGEALTVGPAVRVETSDAISSTASTGSSVDSGADSGSAMLITAQPTELAAPGLRWAWNLASAAVLLGVAVWLWAVLRLLMVDDGSASNPGRAAIFSDPVRGSTVVRIQVGGILLLLGLLARNLLAGSVLEEAGLTRPDTVEPSQFAPWLYEVPAVVLLGLLAPAAWIWSQGRAALRETGPEQA